mgnify:CR=1 FL=1
MLARADIVPYFVLRPSRHADNVLGVTVEIFRLLLIRHRRRLVASRLSLTQGHRSLRGRPLLHVMLSLADPKISTVYYGSNVLSANAGAFGTLDTH